MMRKYHGPGLGGGIVFPVRYLGATAHPYPGLDAFPKSVFISELQRDSGRM